MRPAKGAAQRLSRGIDRVRIDVLADLAGDVGLARQAHGERRERRIDSPRPRVPDQPAESGDETGTALGRLSGAYGLDAPEQGARRETLQRLPAAEIVAVVPREDDEIVLG